MEKVLQLLRTMGVPKLTQLRAGVGVNIVLKADQRTGKLTTGQISEILTRGDHPRGIKIRLSDGQVGRVQSLSNASAGAVLGTPNLQAPAVTAPLATSQSEQENNDFGFSREGRYGYAAGKGRRADYKFQGDYRDEPSPATMHSLEDYIKPSRKPKPAQSSFTASTEANAAQAQLENEFTKLDSALVAAILADHASMTEARRVLQALS